LRGERKTSSMCLQREGEKCFIMHLERRKL
jgi:hypothetical protein